MIEKIGRKSKLVAHLLPKMGDKMGNSDPVA
jgi:hypothetical protein